MPHGIGRRALAGVAGLAALLFGVTTFAAAHGSNTAATIHSASGAATTSRSVEQRAVTHTGAGTSVANAPTSRTSIAGAATGPHGDSIYECNQYGASHGGRQTVLEVNHSNGVITTYSGTTTAPIQSAITQAATNTTAPSSAGSGAGDTVIVCQGTYTATSSSPDITIGVGNDNLTVRSEEGPSSVTIVGDGTAPVVTADDRGLSFGGPAEGFTISVNNAGGATNLTGVQLGLQGAQNTMNEDEQCITQVMGVGVPTGSGCDQAAPADVTINDQIIDNIFTNFKGSAKAAITGIKLDNTINSVVQQNLFKNVAPNGTAVASFQGIVVGGLNETATSTDSAGNATGYVNGDSTNINTAVFQNALVNTLPTNPAGCTTTSPGAVQGIELNGFMLDSQVYNNWLQQILNNTSTCAVTGIASNAYGSLENEQTGTLVPVNGNIDNNTIEELAEEGSTGTTGVYLAPKPGSGTPTPQPAPTGCTTNTPGQTCTDTFPPSSYTVEDNELQQLYRAVDDEALLGANSFIRFNNFDGDAVGVQNGAAAGTQNTALDATNNWWGCELGGGTAATGGTPPPPAPAPHNHGCAALMQSAAGDTSWAPPQTSRVEQAGDEAGDNAGQS